MFENVFRGSARYWAWLGILGAIILIGAPTICMGRTLPLLTKGLSRSIHQATEEHAWLYGINTVGACIGTLAAGFFLIPADADCNNARIFVVSSAVAAVEWV